MEERIAGDLPKKFGLIIDGWSVMGSSTQFSDTFACYENSKKAGTAKTPFSAFSLLVDEASMNALEHTTFIEFTLAVFGKSKDAVSFIVGDNEKLNKSFAKMIGVPLIGCYSHRLNLAVRKYLEPNEPLLEKLINS